MYGQELKPLQRTRAGNGNRNISRVIIFNAVNATPSESEPRNVYSTVIVHICNHRSVSDIRLDLDQCDGFRFANCAHIETNL